MLYSNEDNPTPSDILAQKMEVLNAAQAVLDANKHLFSEDKAWQLQANIDETRFALELDSLVLTARFSQ